VSILDGMRLALGWSLMAAAVPVTCCALIFVLFLVVIAVQDIEDRIKRLRRRRRRS
jgi:uncharacterized membrane-anchored protein